MIIELHAVRRVLAVVIVLLVDATVRLMLPSACRGSCHGGVPSTDHCPFLVVA